MSEKIAIKTMGGINNNKYLLVSICLQGQAFAYQQKVSVKANA